MNHEKGSMTQEYVEIPPRRTPFSGILSVPGDKSMTHRSLFFGALHNGRTIIREPSPALDTRSTLELLRALGHHIAEYPDCWELDPSRRSSHPYRLTLDCGNSGTTARLAAGFLTGERGEFRLVGDESLSRRPMERVAEPLRRIGGRVATTNGAFPVTVIADGKGCDENKNVDTEDAIEVASAQVHAALVLAAARSDSGVLIRRTRPMRDHTLRMAPIFGIEIEERGEGEFVHPRRASRGDDGSPIEVDIPGDLSSAAFLVAAALLVPGSDLTIRDVGLNPTRIAFLEAVRAMGGEIEWNVEREVAEPSGTIHIRYTSDLHGIAAGSDGPLPIEPMMDELPLLALLGSQAKGETVVRGAGELRLKESDRIAATVALLASLGILVEERAEGFRVIGPQRIRGGVSVNHFGDHRLAMLAGVAGLIAEKPVVISEPQVAAVSWPHVWEVIR